MEAVLTRADAKAAGTSATTCPRPAGRVWTSCLSSGLSEMALPVMSPASRANQVRRFRVVLTLFILGLVASGVTAFPLRWELKTLASWVGVSANSDLASLGGLKYWIAYVHSGWKAHTRHIPSWHTAPIGSPLHTSSSRCFYWASARADATRLDFSVGHPGVSWRSAARPNLRAIPRDSAVLAMYRRLIRRGRDHTPDLLSECQSTSQAGNGPRGCNQPDPAD